MPNEVTYLINYIKNKRIVIDYDKTKFEEAKKKYESVLSKRKNEADLTSEIKIFLKEFDDYEVYLQQGMNDIRVLEKTNINNTLMIIEVKIGAGQKCEVNDLAKKALAQLIVYYNDLYKKSETNKLKWLINTDGIEWFIFPVPQFREFINKCDDEIKDKLNPTIYTKEPKKEKVYKDIIEYLKGKGKAFLDEFNRQVIYHKINKLDDDFEPLYTILHPDVVLKKQFYRPVGLNKEFYNEILHIFGLKEVVENGKKKIVPNEIINTFYDQIRKKLIRIINDKSIKYKTLLEIYKEIDLTKFETDEEVEKNFEKEKDNFVQEATYELIITWLNRILFLKLLEAKLYVMNNNDRKYKFLTFENINEISKLKTLFFEVLAVPENNRDESNKEIFNHIPYLNSSLFEETKLEEVVSISDIIGTAEVEYYKNSVLKNENTSTKNKVPLLKYLFDFLDRYNFGEEADVD